MGLMKGSCALLPAALAITSFHTLKAGVDLSSPARNFWPFHNFCRLFVFHTLLCPNPTAACFVVAVVLVVSS